MPSPSPLRPLLKDVLSAVINVRDADIEAALVRVAKLLKDAGIGEPAKPRTESARSESGGRNRQERGGFDRSEG